MGVLESEYFAAVAAHAGVLNEAMFLLIERAPRKIPMAIWVDDSDRLFPVRVVRATQEAFNKHGFDAQLTVIGRHTHWYYDRRPLAGDRAAHRSGVADAVGPFEGSPDPRRSAFQTEDLNAPVLPEVVVEGERPRHLTSVEHGE